MPASTRCSRWCAPSAAGICASSPSSPTAPISDTSSITSGWSQSPRTLPRLAGHRCGKNLMRRRVRAPKSSPIGTWHHSRHRTTRWTSASVGEQTRQRHRSSCGRGCALGRSKRSFTRQIRLQTNTITQKLNEQGSFGSSKTVQYLGSFG